MSVSLQSKQLPFGVWQAFPLPVRWNSCYVKHSTEWYVGHRLILTGLSGCYELIEFEWGECFVWLQNSLMFTPPTPNCLIRGWLSAILKLSIMSHHNPHGEVHFVLWGDQTHCSASDPTANLLVVSVRYGPCGNLPKYMYNLVDGWYCLLRSIGIFVQRCDIFVK